MRESIGVFSTHGARFGTSKPGDIGHDLFVAIDPEDRTLIDRIISLFIGRSCLIIWPIVGVRTIKSGIYLVMPDTVWAEIRPRSSTSRKKLNVIGGTIDSGYRGEMFTVLHNLGFTPRLIIEGERYAQVAFHGAHRPDIVHVSENAFRGIIEADCAMGARGMTGFGSTGA